MPGRITDQTAPTPEMQYINTPLVLLEVSEQEKVEVHLVDGSIVKGYLVDHDEMINLLLKNVEIVVDGQSTQRLNNMLIRGGNVKFLTKLNINALES